MAITRPQGEVQNYWQNFVRGLKSTFGMLPEHRHEDQFLRVKEAAMALAENSEMAAEIEQGYRGAVLGTNNEPVAGADAVEVVVMELEAFPIAVQVHEAEAKAGTAKPGAAKRL